MSTLRTNRIELGDGSQGVDISYIVNGSAKVWAKFLPLSGGTIDGSFNVSSVVDGGVGKFTINYTNAFSSAQNAPIGSAGMNSTAPGELYTVGAAQGDVSGQTALLHVANINDAGSYIDTNPCFCNVLGDLA
ncbi:MAG: hypothetical protein HWE34_12710 [Methylocystaceae bacterium]|nr:hypothetical protein [Methylocystaceae bacterium]